MSLNMNNMPAGGPVVDYGIPNAGAHPAYLYGIVDTGVQDGGHFNGQAKNPSRKLVLLFELTDDKITLPDGVVTSRYFSHTVTASSSENSNLYKIVRQLNGGQPLGELSALIGKPCLLNLKHEVARGGPKAGKTIAKYDGLMALPEGFYISTMTLKPTLFDLDQPDIEVFKGLFKWLRGNILGSIGFENHPQAAVLKQADAEVMAAFQARAQTAQYQAPQVNSAPVAQQGLAPGYAPPQGTPQVYTPAMAPPPANNSPQGVPQFNIPNMQGPQGGFPQAQNTAPVNTPNPAPVAQGSPSLPQGVDAEALKAIGLVYDPATGTFKIGG